MADLRFSLEAVRDELRPAPAANAGPQRTRPRAAVIWIGLLALATAGAALIPRYFTSGSAPPEPTTRSTILLAGEDVLDTRGSSLALSKDGRLLAFVGSTGTSSRLYVRPLDAFDPTPLPGTEDAMSPFFSPTGDWLGFFANGKLQKIRVDGGKPIVLCDADVGRGGAWAADDTIVFNPSAAFGAGLMRISAAGGTPQPISHPDPMQDEQSHRWPEFLPDGKHVLFTIWTSTGLSTSRLAVLDLATGKLRTLSEVGSYGRFASGGLLAFIRSEGLMISRLDPEALTFKEAPVFTGVSVLGSGSNGTAQFDIGPSGLLIYAAGVNSSRSILVSVDRNGSEQPLYDKPGFYVTPRLSPDGKHLLFGAVDSGNFDVWAMELARKSPVRVTFGRTAEYYSIWEADGKHVTYSSNRQGPLNLFSSPADGTALEQRLTTAPNPQFANEWTRDGSILAFTQFGADTGSDIWLLKKGAASPVSFLQTSFSERDPAFSPNGKWLAYTSNESGANEVYVRSVAGIGKSKISVAGGTEPVWTASGRELLFRRGNEMMAAAIRMQPFFAADPPRALFRGNYSAQHSSRNYDVTADGRQFVMMKNVDDQSPPRALHVVSNAFKELSGRRELKRP